MDAELDVEELLEDQEDLELASALAVHLAVMRCRRQRAHASLCGQRPRHRGSVQRRLPNKKRSFELGMRLIHCEKWGVEGEPPIYDERDFERRFGVPRAVVVRIYDALKDCPSWKQSVNATGRVQSHPMQKNLSPFGVLANGQATDRSNEYARLPSSNLETAVKKQILQAALLVLLVLATLCAPSGPRFRLARWMASSSARSLEAGAAATIEAV